MAFVLDVSVALKWFLADEWDPFAGELLERVTKEGALVPALFRWEVASALLGAERAGRIAPDDVDDALDVLRDLAIFVEPPGERCFSESEVRFARLFELTPYDAAYLSLAAGHHLPLATNDTDLAHAARDLGIVVLAH